MSTKKFDGAEEFIRIRLKKFVVMENYHLKR